MFTMNERRRSRKTIALTAILALIASTLLVGLTVGSAGAITMSDPVLTVQKSGPGYVSGVGIDCGVDCTETYPGQQVCDPDLKPPCHTEWQTVTLTSYPPAGFALSWSGCDTASTNTCDITMDSNKTVTATDTDIADPTVSLTAPSSGVYGGTIGASATASDNAGISKVDFLVDGSVWVTDTSAPYSTSIDTTLLVDGVHTVSARAQDTSGRASVLSSVTITVDNTAPSLTVTGPANGKVFAPGTSKTWNIAASDAHLASVTCAVDGAAASPCTPTGTGTWSYTDSTSVLGPHSLAITATDSAGNAKAVTRTWSTKAPTTTTLIGTLSPTQVLANGSVSPNQAGKKMNVTLFKKQSGVFVKVATNHPVLDANSAYTTAFTRPVSTGYKITAVFPGTTQYLKSSKSVTLP
jgi:hypothetical protein